MIGTAQVGVAKPARQATGTDELYLSEREFQTYVEGPWKSTVRREDDRLFLYDLEADTAETRSAAEARPEIAARHRERMAEVSRRLAVQTGVEKRRLDRTISEEERRTLEALGYVE